MAASGESWLCDAPSRARLVEMGARMRPARAGTMLLELGALLAFVGLLGWWVLLPALFAVAGFLASDRPMARSSRPELWYLAAWSNGQAMVALAAALSGGPKSPLVVWMPILVCSLAARFTTRGVAVGVGITLLFLAAATFGAHPSETWAHAELFVFPAVAVMGSALLSTGLMRSDVMHRTEAAVDPLTQLLNRKALYTRAAELEEQARVTGEPVGVIVGDLDNFKAVNDEHGHQTGDEVLREVAARLRKTLRAYDLAYRLGGEEFLVVLPGAALDEASELAERLRRTVSATPVAGVPVTISFGVAATHPGEAFHFSGLYARADAALYEAKAAGRDCVRGGHQGRRLTALAGGAAE